MQPVVLNRFTTCQLRTRLSRLRIYCCLFVCLFCIFVLCAKLSHPHPHPVPLQSVGQSVGLSLSLSLSLSLWLTASLTWWLRRPPRERKIPGSNPGYAQNFPGSSHTSDFKIGTPVATLPGAWRYRVSAGTGRPGVCILWLCKMESLICNFYFSVVARTIVWADPSLRYTRMLLGR